jgi:hypothetical protein
VRLQRALRLQRVALAEDNCFEGKILKANNHSPVTIIKDYYETIWEQMSETPIKKWWKKILPQKP